MNFDLPVLGINIPADHWRWRAANLSHQRWVAWRCRSAAIQVALGPEPSAEEIYQADESAYFELYGHLEPRK